METAGSDPGAAADLEVVICEVAPRDGLQNEDPPLSAEVRGELVRRLLEAGCPAVEAGSLVRADVVPQMADSETVVALAAEGAERIGLLVLNERGLERAVQTSASAIHVVHPVTDEFARRNQGVAAGEALERSCRLLEGARARGRQAVGILAASFGCPFEGAVDPHVVAWHARCLDEAGAEVVVLADTIGTATPRAIRAGVRAAAAVTSLPLGLHLHNTRNAGYANALAGLEEGVRRFDASVGGFGGCPFAPNATGNVATEDLAWILEREGAAHGLDIERLCLTAEWLSRRLGRQSPGLLHRAGRFPPGPA